MIILSYQYSYDKYIKYLGNYINKEIIGIEKIQLILYSSLPLSKFYNIGSRL